MGRDGLALMIIARSPMRISLGGGGTDLPSYYESFGGFVLAAAIDKYMYMTINQSWSDEYILKYSSIERTRTVDEIQHPIFKATLSSMKVGPNIELVSVADIPAGTGLGSSGSFTTALLKVLHVHKKNKNVIVTPHELAEQACHIEMNILNEPVGKQDQYIAAYGGVTCFDIDKAGYVKAYPAQLSQQTLFSLEDNLVMFFTGYSRASSLLLKEQDTKSKEQDAEMLENLHYVKDLGFRIKEALQYWCKSSIQIRITVHHSKWHFYFFTRFTYSTTCAEQVLPIMRISHTNTKCFTRSYICSQSFGQMSYA